MLKLHDKLEDLGDDQLEACARLVTRRGNLRASLNGMDGADFVQEALRKVLAGERRLNPAASLEENVVRIGLSMIWGERQRQSERSMSAMTIPAAFSPDLGPDTVGDLHEALRDAASALGSLEAKGGVYRDAAQFIACLTHQIEQRGSIRPGHIANLLGMTRERAYVAWRKVKVVMREQIEGTNP